MGKFEQANEIVIQSGFRNPEFKTLSVASGAQPSLASDGVTLPKSERAIVFAKATSASVGRVDVWGLLKSVDEWLHLGHFFPDDSGGFMFVREAGLFSRVYAQATGSVDSAKLGYPIDE